MSDPIHASTDATSEDGQRWTSWLIVFLRFMAFVSMAKGIYHWSAVLGIGDTTSLTFDAKESAWQAATVYFAVIDLVAAVGLWLTAAWGGVLWLTAAISMVAIELFFPDVFGGSYWVVGAEICAMAIYFALAIAAGRERAE